MKLIARCVKTIGSIWSRSRKTEAEDSTRFLFQWEQLVGELARALDEATGNSRINASELYAFSVVFIILFDCQRRNIEGSDARAVRIRSLFFDRCAARVARESIGRGASFRYLARRAVEADFTLFVRERLKTYESAFARDFAEIAQGGKGGLMFFDTSSLFVDQLFETPLSEAMKQSAVIRVCIVLAISSAGQTEALRGF